MDFSSLVTITSHEITDPSCGDKETYAARLLPESSEVISDRVVLLHFDQGMKHPDYQENLDEPQGLDLMRWRQVAISIVVNPEWRLLCASANKWNARMVLVKKCTE